MLPAPYVANMKTTDAEILIIPGYKGASEDHWQSRWERNISSARFVEMGDWHKPVFEDWKANLLTAVAAAQKPVFLVGHSIGSQVIVQAASEFEKPVAGALLVAPPDVENPSIRPKHLLTFGPASREPLPFPSLTIASRNDHFCSYEKAEDMAAAWGSLFMDAGESGHINHESGHGPWPEGLMVFSRFLNQISL
jgi:predicted alpha/beta hydrolase family esterase